MFTHNLLVMMHLTSAVSGCATHTFNHGLARRADVDGEAIPAGNKTADNRKWTYEASYDWGRVSRDYTLCQAGTHQSPIPLSSDQGVSKLHIPTFNYENLTAGECVNWGYGPAFHAKLADRSDAAGRSSVTFDGKTVFLAGWHTHTPADHTIDGVRSRAEVHLVHVDAAGTPAAVFAIMLDSTADDAVKGPDNYFLSQSPKPFIGFDDTKTKVPCELSLKNLIDDMDNFRDFWTYEGSLTSPPCTEGIRWFVAKKKLLIGVQDMVQLLAASTFSARAEQNIWQHRVNQ